MGLRVGTIGYRQLFPELPASARFRRYAELFDTVELPGTYLPNGQERRALRRFLRRHTLLGTARGGVRFRLPPDLEPAAFAEWLALLADLGLPGEYAFEGPRALEELALAAGHAAVNLSAGPFYYLIDPDRLPEGSGYAYFNRLEDALRYSTLAQGGAIKNQTR